MCQDNDLFAAYGRLGMLMVERYAAKTDDTIHVHVRELEWITGKGRRDAALRVLQRLEEVTPISVGLLAEVGGTSVGSLQDFHGKSAELPGEVLSIKLPNFAKKHGMHPVIDDTREKIEERREKKEEGGEAGARKAAPSGDETPERKTKAPEELTEDQLRQLRSWRDDKRPWIKDVDLDSKVERCLGWFRGNGGRKIDWVQTCRNWVSKDDDEAWEKRGKEKPDPAAWRERYERLRVVQEKLGPALDRVEKQEAAENARARDEAE
jgi:hypothetical protein